VVTYDPRGLGRSTRNDGRVDNSPTVQAGDVHALIEALDAGLVEMFASSGGAVTALALVAAHPGDVTVLVAHEPPLSRCSRIPQRLSAPGRRFLTPMRLRDQMPAWRRSSR
jgi:pimeloyl-ACP methyl ester carboxylesterase